MAVDGQQYTPTASPRVHSPVPSMQEAGLAPGTPPPPRLYGHPEKKISLPHWGSNHEPYSP